MGKKARKTAKVASTCFAQAQSVPTPSIDNAIGWIGKVQMQLAKLEHQARQTSAALLILGVVEVKGPGKLSDVERRYKSASRINKITGRTSVGSDQEASHHIATRQLKSTTWIAEGGLKAVPEIMESFRVSNQLRPKWEKSHFEFGKYVDSWRRTSLECLNTKGGLQKMPVFANMRCLKI